MLPEISPEETMSCADLHHFATIRRAVSCISHIMDQILAIPADRRRVNQPMLCALMGLTALLLIGWQGLAPNAETADAASALSGSVMTVASR
ncbi:hypothetical protein [Acidimangrovimonas sediminis]|uniref:hypothetical protein n=1 Tax=Acidimangrovimonas sediminis TaxID=2056283 RepID=UPI0011AEEBEF|nr:hypothetical protein [Acidimangrovimonas sediminis]